MSLPPKLSLLVLRAVDPEALARMYKVFGCKFQREQHGTGPVHLSTMLGDVVFEIYPRTAEQPATVGVRLGFRVADLDRTLTKLLGLGATVLSAAKDTEWGRRAVVADTEGHPVELTEYLA